MPINHIPIQGVWTALASPFKSSGAVDWEAFDRLLTHQIEGEVNGVVISGTTGESPTLTAQEKLAMIRKARVKLPSNIRVMAGTGDSNTNQSVELSRLAQDAGADSLLVVTPPYNKPSTAGLILHYKSIVDSVEIPVCLYHVPSRTAHWLSLDALKTICVSTGISAIKEASGDMGYFSRAHNSIQTPLLSGDDPTFLASLAVGGKGIISVASNIFPKALVELFNAANRGNFEHARKIHNLLLPVFDVLFCEVNPCPVKAALKILGLAENYLRLPLAPVAEDSFTKIAQTITQASGAIKACL